MFLQENTADFRLFAIKMCDFIADIKIMLYFCSHKRTKNDADRINIRTSDTIR